MFLMNARCGSLFQRSARLIVKTMKRLFKQKALQIFQQTNRAFVAGTGIEPVTS